MEKQGGEVRLNIAAHLGQAAQLCHLLILWCGTLQPVHRSGISDPYVLNLTTVTQSHSQEVSGNISLRHRSHHDEKPLD